MKQTLRHIFLLLALFVATILHAQCNYEIDNEKNNITTTEYSRKVWWGNEKYHQFPESTIIGSVYSTHGISNVTITITLERTGGGKDAKVKFEYSTNGSNWTQIGSEKEIDGTWQAWETDNSLSISETVNISANTTVQFRVCETKREEYGSSRKITISNFNVTMTSTLQATPSSWDFGKIRKGDSTPSKSFNVSYSNVGSTLSALSNSAHFTVSPTSINSDCIGETTFTVTYNPQETGNHNGIITIDGKDTNTTKKSISINVSGIATGDPTHTWKGEDEYFVDDELDLNSLWVSTNTSTESPKIYKVVTFQEDDNTGVTPILNGSSIKLTRAGKLTISMTQDAHGIYNEKTSTQTLTIKKHEPTFTWNDADLYWDRTLVDYFSTTNLVTPITIESQTDTEVANIYFSTSNTNDQHTLDITTYNKVGNTSFVTITQAENYYWKKHTEEHEIKPKDPSNHVTFTIDFEEKMTKIFKHSSNNEDDLTWDNGIRLGDDDWVAGPGGGNKDGGFDWSDKYIIIKFTGIPDSLFLTTDTDDAATTEIGSNVYFSISEGYIPQGTGDITFTKIWEYTKQNNDIALKLDPQTRCIKLCYTGNLRGWFKGTDKYSGVTVTELDEFYAVETTTEPTKTEIEHLNFGPNQVTIDTTLYFDIKYANAGYKVKAVSNDNHFTVTPSETSSMGGDKYGLQTFAVTYTSNVPYATVDNNSYITITDELEHIKGHKDIVYLHASSDLATQQLYWRDDFAAVETPLVRISHDTIQHAAHSSSKLEITYTSSDPTVIEVIEDGTVLKLLKPGEATITATQKGNNLFKPADQIEKTFIVTDKLLQFIIWTDAPTDIVKSGDNQTITLNAQVHVQTDNGEIVYSEERTNMLKYTSGTPNIVSVTDNTLHVNTIGKTTLTASVVGDDDYAEASLTVPVIVRSETAGCPDPLLYELEEPIQFFQGNTFEIVKNPIPLNTDVGIPGYVIVEHTGNEWRLPVIGTTFYAAAIRVEEKTASNSNWTVKDTIYPQKGQVMLDTIAISRDATEIRFVRNAGGQGYQFLNKIEVHPAQFIESVDEVDFGQILVGSKSTQTFDLSYSNIKDVLSPEPSSKDVVVTPKEFGACGTFGTQLITVDWTPTKVSPENGYTTETITFTDLNSGMKKVVTLKAIVQKGPQSILWNDWGGEFPKIISHCDLIDLNLPAKTTADIDIVWEVSEGKDCADFINGELHLYKDGTITLKASNSGSDNYLPFEQTFTITIQVNPIFLGTEDKAWENPNNWNYQRIPCEVEPVTLQAPATLSTHTTVASLTFNSENSQANSLHITSTGGLTLGEQGITNAADNGSSLVIDNTYDGAGFLRIDPRYQGTTRLTMRYQTKSTLDNGANSDADWQYIGAPGNDCSIYVDYNTWLYKLDEQKKDWELQARTADVPLTPFEGYAITQYGKPTYEWTANFTNANRTIPLTYSKDGRSGRHIFANSYTAPIDVKALDGLITYHEGEQDRFRIEQTVYIFNSGSWNDWNRQPQKGDDTPGQYYAIPIAAAAANYLSEEQTVIPPMQGFYMRVRSKTPSDQLNPTEQVGQILLDYNTVVMGDNHKMNTAMRAPQRHVPTPNQNFQRIRIQATSANSGADRLYIIQDEINTRKYNNGYDAPNQTTNGIVNIYTNESFGKMEVSCSDNIDSLYIGFMAGEDSLYTLTFGAQRGEIYLKDLQNDSIIHMLNGKQYHFIATPHSTNDLRFQVLLHPDFNYDFSKEEKDEIITNVTDIPATQVWSDGKIVYIANAPINSTAKVFNISGQALLSTTINCMPYTLNLSHLSAGVYMLQLNNKVYKFVCK